MDKSENFLADKPISEENEDQFQRYAFSKRIAETIYNRTNSESIVIGLYGAWGEGKTSVLNFIRQELSPFKPEIIHFTFNPWRFTDEAALLTSFFNTLAKEIKKSFEQKGVIQESNKQKENFITRQYSALREYINKRKEDAPLKSGFEVFGDQIQEYGKLISIFGVGEIAEGLGKALSNVDVEDLKLRIETLLKEHKRRIVVFIDDIDRLDKQEIHSIFRLVKLTGDFAYTTYVLSFDENMVASAIGERFGSGDFKAGLNFIEKIVQIPIKLPLAQKTALQNFCFKLVEQALNSSQIELTEEEGQEFVRKFTTNIIGRLTTPRLAVRYGNSLSFSLPLLKGEVNYVDLLLIEAIRVFYPEVYDYIKYNPDDFIGSYQDYGSNSINKEKAEKFRARFEEVTQKYDKDQVEDSKWALGDLFPILKKVWGDNWINWDAGTPEKRYDQKRISTSQYFNRYFSYTVIEGDISDVALNDFITFSSTGNLEEIKSSLHQLVVTSTPANFIEKLRSKEKNLDPSAAMNISKGLSQIGEDFPETGKGFYHWLTPRSQAAIFIGQIVNYNVKKDERLPFVQWLIENAKPFEFAYTIFNYCRHDSSEPTDQLFSDEEYAALAIFLKNRAIKDADDTPIWEKFTFQSRYMFNAWSEKDYPGLNNYIVDWLNKKDSSLPALIRVFTDHIISSAHPQPYYSDLDKKSYDWMKRTVNIDNIYPKVQELLGDKFNTAITYTPLEYKQTDENLMHQFVYWYNKDIPS